MEIFSDRNLAEQLSCLEQFDIYRDSDFWTEEHSVWKRSLRPQSFPYTIFSDISRGNLLNYSSLTLNRIMTALYEQDFLYLPMSSESIIMDLQMAYNPTIRKLAAEVLPVLERKVFQNIRSEINVGGEWNKDVFKKYLADKFEGEVDSEVGSIDFILQSDDPQLMARLLLIQHSVDFLPESSHMVRFAKGDYGEAQSALFRVLLDEFGYGKHAEKHSSLFKKTLKSIGMHDNSHAYWNFYLTSSLLNNNYFHMLTKNPENFFEYIGAITYAENSFGPYCKRVKEILNKCFGNVDSRYYAEHEHIDSHHGVMTLNEILLPLADKFGSNVYLEFVKGIEMSCLLQQIMEDDLKAQMEWMEKKSQYIKLAMNIKSNVLGNIENIPVACLNELKGELSVPHVHDGDEFCIVDEGLLRFCHGPDCFSDLGPGECVVIRKNRLHGALILSEYCKYRVFSIEDYRKYANYII